MFESRKPHGSSLVSLTTGATMAHLPEGCTAMKDGDEVYAVALLNEPTFLMLQSSLKRVYRVDNTHRFDELIRQLDEVESSSKQ